MSASASLEAGIFQLLSQDAALAALQGANVFFVLLPEASKLPATTFRAVGGSGQPTLGSSGPQKLRFEFNFRAANGPDAVSLRDSARTVLDRFTGPLPNGFLVTDIQWHSSSGSDFDSDARNFRIAEDYYVRFNLP